MLKLLKAVLVAAPLVLAACSTEVTSKSDQDRECSLSKAETLVSNMLSPYGIKSPTFEQSSGKSEYIPTTGVISLRDCAPDEVVAHEVGHYVFDVFVGFDYGQHIVQAQSLFCPAAPDCPGPWGPKDESNPGLEISAHCISEILYKKSRYTECPSQDTRLQAVRILDSLKSRA